jgi:hypothetical protein
MRRLESRLSAVEGKLRPKPPMERRGMYETHHTEAWPACNDIPGCEAVHCTDAEHGPNCAVTYTPVYSSVYRVIILQGSGAGPWMSTS